MKTKEKIKNPSDLKPLVDTWHTNNEKIVFTNGCFDILHLGHVDYLENASLLGTKLIVALNSDASVSALKGPSRPVNDEISRSRIIAALQFVDAVIIFGEDTPYDMIAEISPHVLVKGEDYDVHQEDPNHKQYIVGADIMKKTGGDVKTISFIHGYSTTSIVNKIQQ